MTRGTIETTDRDFYYFFFYLTFLTPLTNVLIFGYYDYLCSEASPRCSCFVASVTSKNSVNLKKRLRFKIQGFLFAICAGTKSPDTSEL